MRVTWFRSQPVHQRRSRELSPSQRRKRPLLVVEQLEDRSLLSGFFGQLEFQTALTNFNLTGPAVPLPLASDPGNALGDSIDGFGLVNSVVTISLSSQRTPPGHASTGMAIAFEKRQDGATDIKPLQGNLPPFDPSTVPDGTPFTVFSFFDVFFDIAVQDVDNRAGRDFAGMPNGATLHLLDTGPAHLLSMANHVPFMGSQPNFGLVPPPASAPYIGHFQIEIPLGGDINQNGENDKIKFSLVEHTAGDTNRTFIQLPNGTILDQFDSAAFLQGAIVDQSTDPPFTIGMNSNPSDPIHGVPLPPSMGGFGGPVTASSLLLNPVLQNVAIDTDKNSPAPDSFEYVNENGNKVKVDLKGGAAASAVLVLESIPGSPGRFKLNSIALANTDPNKTDLKVDAKGEKGGTFIGSISSPTGLHDIDLKDVDVGSVSLSGNVHDLKAGNVVGAFSLVGNAHDIKVGDIAGSFTITGNVEHLKAGNILAGAVLAVTGSVKDGDVGKIIGLVQLHSVGHDFKTDSQAAPGDSFVGDLDLMLVDGGHIKIDSLADAPKIKTKK